jgi:DNA-binding NarL/FixJ family response regulator
MVVLASRGSEDAHTPSSRRALSVDQSRRSHSLHVAHRESPNGDFAHTRNDVAAERSRTVVACVAVSLGDTTRSSNVSSTLLQVLSKLVRDGDRICTTGAGRVLVVFDRVGPALSAGVLGTRLASSAVSGLTETGGISARVVVGVADGEAGSDTSALSCAAIDSARSPGPGDQAGSRSFVVATASPRPGHPTIARRVVGRVANAAAYNCAAVNGTGAHDATAPSSVFVFDTDPLSAGVPGPASRAVTSLIENTGLRVAGTLAPASHFDASVSIPEWPLHGDVLAVLVVHPGSDTDGDVADLNATFDKPAQLTHVLRQNGMRVLAVSVGASNIALAECVVNGAEGAFGIGDLPDGLANALATVNGHRERTDPDSTSAVTEGHTPRVDRLTKLLLLTRSERRVLYHLTTGSTATEIAENLVLSIATVRSHIRSILRKLEVTSQLAAVAMARDHPQRNAESERDRPSERPARITQPAGAVAPGR